MGNNLKDGARITLRSPAKINLFLRVLGKRGDGYHELSTLIQAIDYFDELTIEKAEVDRFTCTDSALPLDGRNLVLKALNLFRENTGWQEPLSIHLKKNIPSEAGLGGGSGNAATMLFACNQLANTSLSMQGLADLSAQIGSDIPYFFSKGAAICKGRGEIVEEVAAPAQTLSLYKPPFGLSTPLVFKALDLLPSSSCNHLEGAALKLSKELAAFKEELLALGCIDLAMSGSGTTFFSTVRLADHPFYLGTFKTIVRSSDTSWWE